MVMLDLQKAFDTVDHSILLGKLELMGVQSTSWFKSYLSDRSQIVQLGKTMSGSNTVTCGVPQGSILGPLLFLCYVNDMITSIDKDCKLILYADDSTILFAHPDPQFISSKLGLVLENCSEWLVDNKLSLHLGKTECMLFGPKHKLKRQPQFSVTCKDHTIQGSKEVKYLGLTIDSFLSREPIVSSIISKVNAKLKFLYRQSKCLDLKTKQLLCSALIQCHFDYSCSSWYEGLNKGLKNKLQVTQNKVIRFLHGFTPRTSLSYTNFQDLGLLNVQDRVKQIRLNHVHKIYYNTCPTYMLNNFTLRSDVVNRRTRTSSYNFVLPRCTTITNNTFFYHGIKDWNALPDRIKSIRNLGHFKKSVKAHLHEKATERANATVLYNF